jgi:hypothetical protein
MQARLAEIVVNKTPRPGSIQSQRSVGLLEFGPRVASCADVVSGRGLTKRLLKFAIHLTNHNHVHDDWNIDLHWPSHAWAIYIKKSVVFLNFKVLILRVSEEGFSLSCLCHVFACLLIKLCQFSICLTFLRNGLTLKEAGRISIDAGLISMEAGLISIEDGLISIATSGEHDVYFEV